MGRDYYNFRADGGFGLLVPLGAVQARCKQDRVTPTLGANAKSAVPSFSELKLWMAQLMSSIDDSQRLIVRQYEWDPDYNSDSDSDCDEKKERQNAHKFVFFVTSDSRAVSTMEVPGPYIISPLSSHRCELMKIPCPLPCDPESSGVLGALGKLKAVFGIEESSAEGVGTWVFSSVKGEVCKYILYQTATAADSYITSITLDGDVQHVSKKQRM